jgi:hypothetical protein
MASTKSIPFNPTTTHGKGLLPPLVRALSHSFLVIGASLHEWPMTNEQAKLELDEAITHSNGLSPLLPNILTELSQGYIETWRNETTELRKTLGAADQDLTIATLKEPIRKYSEATLGLLTVLDLELVGLPATETDPGQLP